MHSLFLTESTSRIYHGSRAFSPPTYICKKKSESDRKFWKKIWESRKKIKGITLKDSNYKKDDLDLGINFFDLILNFIGYLLSTLEERGLSWEPFSVNTIKELTLFII